MVKKKHYTTAKEQFLAETRLLLCIFGDLDRETAATALKQIEISLLFYNISRKKKRKKKKHV